MEIPPCGMWAPPLPWNPAEAGQPVELFRGTEHITHFCSPNNGQRRGHHWDHHWQSGGS